MTTTIQKNKGFTLMELLTVIAILSFLTTIVLSSLATAKTKAENAKYTSEMVNLRSALYIDRAETGILLGSGSPAYAADLNTGGSFESVLSPLVSREIIPTIPHYSNWPTGSNIAFTYQYSEYKVNTSTDAIVCGNPVVANATEATERNEAVLLLYTTDPEVEMLGVTPGIRVCDGSSCDPLTGTTLERIYCMPV